MKRTNFVIVAVRLILTLSCAGSALRGVLAGFARGEFTASYFVTAFTALLALVITHIPDFISHKDIMVIPAALQTAFTLFTFMAMFFGEILSFYGRFRWWDSMLHFSSGIMFGIIGYMLFVSLNRDSGIRRRLNPVSVVLFVFCFSVACGTVWEIFEFAGDSLFGMNMQRWMNNYSPAEWAALQNMSNASNPGLMDTMKDIINDTVGTLISITMILPLVKWNNRYVKTGVTSEDLLEESRIAVAQMRIRQRPVAVIAARANSALEDLDTTNIA